MNEALQNHAFIHAVRKTDTRLQSAQLCMTLVFVDVKVEICLVLRKRLTEPQVQKLSILENLRRRVKDFLPELRQHFDKVWLAWLPIGTSDLMYVLQMTTVASEGRRAL